MDGIQSAKARDVQFGRENQLTKAQSVDLRRQRKEGVLIKTLMEEYHLSKASVYRYLNQK